MENAKRAAANAAVLRRMCEANPILEDVRPAGEVVPGMTPSTILTSGPLMPWGAYHGGQRDAIIGAAQYEKLATTRDEAIALLAAGKIRLQGCHDLACVGSLAGVYTASMPVFVVRNATHGNIAYCNFYEGHNPRRLNYGVYDEGVRAQLDHVNNVIAPVLGQAVRQSGGIPLKPLMVRALHMGDELHSRNTAASLMFARELFPALMRVAQSGIDGLDDTLDLLTRDHYFFLRLSMAAAKATADAAHGIEWSSVVTAMAFNCREFGVRVSGLDRTWHTGPQPDVHAKLFDGHTEDEISWMGGESTITETIGLGGFAQAAAFALQAYQGGSPQVMIDSNLSMYNITVGENSDFKIPYLAYRGTPTAIDIFKVAETGITPVMDIGIAGRNGGQIGAGLVKANVACFSAACDAYRMTYGTN
jgi:hypothetical protein